MESKENFGNLEERITKLENLLAQKSGNGDVLEQIKKDKGITNEDKRIKHREKILSELKDNQGVKFYSCIENKSVSAYSILSYDEQELLNVDSFSAEKLFTAFASSERVEILKLLMKKTCTGAEIMQECGFKTTRKLYYHLNFLLNIGIIGNDDGVYHLVAKMCSVVQAMFMAAVDLDNAFKKYEK